MRIGIFGGSFNPPHKMHKNIALNLIKNNYLDKVIYVPTGNRYNKKDLIDCKHRYNMLKLMIEKYKNLELSDYELKNTLTYTYQTLNYFKSIYPNDEIYFICGSDNLKEIKTWKNYKYILENYKILVIKRNDDNLDDIVNNYQQYKEKIIISTIKSETLSSTFIRNNINNQKVKKYLLNNVYRYIIDNKIYGTR